MKYVIDILIATSLFFAIAGVVGMLRMPDSFCRMQSSTNISTFGVLGVILGGVLHCLFIFETPDWAMAVKLIVMGVFYIVTNPIAGHAIAKAAYKKGIRPEKEMVCDKYGEDLENAD